MHQEFEPPEELRDAIKCFWHEDRIYSDTPTSFEVLPDGYAEIIFHFGTGCSIIHEGKTQPLPSPFLMGLLNEPIHFSTKNHFQIIAVRCFPWTVFDLLGLPSGKNSVSIFEHPVAKLQVPLSQFVAANKIADAIKLVTQYFMEMHAHISVDSMLYKAGIAMRAANGTMPVSDIAAAAHATVRTLERNFKQSSGHTVKDVSALIRFEQVRNTLWHYPETNLAGLAAESGYADQSHMSKEFKRYSGTTPAAFARRTKQSKLAVSKDFIALGANDEQ